MNNNLNTRHLSILIYSVYTIGKFTINLKQTDKSKNELPGIGLLLLEIGHVIPFNSETPNNLKPEAHAAHT